MENREDLMLLAEISAKLDVYTRHTTELEKRVKNLERWMYALPVTAVGALISAISAIIIALG